MTHPIAFTQLSLYIDSSWIYFYMYNSNKIYKHRFHQMSNNRKIETGFNERSFKLMTNNLNSNYYESS